jgi:cold shock CspA family protein
MNRLDIPLQIAFRRVQKPSWAEKRIRSRVDKLVSLHDRIVGCRVTVEQRAQNTEGTLPPVVHIEISIPGAAPIVVAYEPDRLQQRYQHPELGNAINHAFSIAERRLAEWKGLRSGRRKETDHDIQNQFLGQVAEMHPQEDHGFLMNKEGGLLYFHRNSVLGGDFDTLRLGDEVHYVEEIGDTGPLATKVRPASRH